MLRKLPSRASVRGGSAPRANRLEQTKRTKAKDDFMGVTSIPGIQHAAGFPRQSLILLFLRPILVAADVRMILRRDELPKLRLLRGKFRLHRQVGPLVGILGIVVEFLIAIRIA